jgi:3-methyladenine DNA glycosylase AlkD
MGLPRQMTLDEVLLALEARARPEAVAGMARVGIATSRALGVSMPDLRSLARTVGRDHGLALRLWQEGLRETRILASLVADPKQVTGELLEEWVAGFDSWEVCDQCCMNLFQRTPFAWSKALEWSVRQEEYVKRAGFVLMARLAHRDTKAPDSAYEPFLAAVAREAGDGRNNVRKAANWALRDIGKRNLALCERSIAGAEQIRAQGTPSARWIASDALRELRSPAVQERLRERQPRQET